MVLKSKILDSFWIISHNKVQLGLCKHMKMKEGLCPLKKVVPIFWRKIIIKFSLTTSVNFCLLLKIGGTLQIYRNEIWSLSIKKVAPIFWRRIFTKFHLQLVIIYFFDWEIINLCADHFLYPKCLALSPKKGIRT